MRRLSPAGAAFIQRFEAYRPVGYLPTPNDRPTAGWGHTGPDVQVGVHYSDEQCAAWFAADVEWAERVVDTHAPQGITQNAFDALVSLTFNIGAANFDASTLLRDLTAGDDVAAADEFLRWDRQRGQVLPGLDARREAERALFDTPGPVAV
jgi:lysozyme